jgi:putative PIN family toxin of toxin-antitoxin system
MSESSVKPRSVADTNLFVSGAISPGGSPHRLLQAWLDQHFHLLLSEEQFDEIVGVFRRPRLIKLFHYSRDELAALFATLAAPRVTPAPVVPLRVRDPKDVEILAAALGGEADYLVTGDADLLELRDDPRLGPLRIVTAAQFLANLADAPTRGEGA